MSPEGEVLGGRKAGNREWCSVNEVAARKERLQLAAEGGARRKERRGLPPARCLVASSEAVRVRAAERRAIRPATVRGWNQQCDKVVRERNASGMNNARSGRQPHSVQRQWR